MNPNKKKVAIVEDESILIELLSKKLKQEGYDVVTAVDGEQGLERIVKEKPDLVLLDIIMPKMNGYEVLNALQNRFGDKMPPVIIISNSGQPVEIDKARDLGAKDFIIKAQFTPEEVVKKVNQLIGLPVAGEAKVKMDDESDDKNEVLTTQPPKPEARILIVEDDQFLSDLLSTKLKKENFSVLTAIDGPGGVAIIEKEMPDVILLDIILPGIDGFEVLKRVRSNSNMKIAKTPIVLLSNLGQETDIEKGRSLGADDYLIKSNFTIDEIIEKIRKILKSRK